MHHLAAAVPKLELAGNPARGPDRQPRPHPFMIGEEEDQLDVSGVVLDQHLERRSGTRIRRPAMLSHLGLDRDDRARNRVADLRTRAAVDRSLRQVEEDVDHPRALGLIEQAVEQLRVLGPDPRQGAGGREQGIESRGTHHAPSSRAGSSLQDERSVRPTNCQYCKGRISRLISSPAGALLLDNGPPSLHCMRVMTPAFRIIRICIISR